VATACASGGGAGVALSRRAISEGPVFREIRRPLRSGTLTVDRRRCVACADGLCVPEEGQGRECRGRLRRSPFEPRICLIGCRSEWCAHEKGTDQARPGRQPAKQPQEVARQGSGGRVIDRQALCQACRPRTELRRLFAAEQVPDQRCGSGRLSLQDDRGQQAQVGRRAARHRRFNEAERSSFSSVRKSASDVGTRSK